MIRDINNFYSELKSSKFIDLGKVYWICKKSFLFIISFTIFFVIFGMFYYKNKPKVYLGQFQIVVSKNENLSNSLNLDSLTGLLGSRNSSSLKTQIEILKSESVLLPLYEFVKTKRIELGLQEQNLSFNSLKSSVDIEVLPSTTVLKVSYKSRYKEEIPDVLEKISFLYKSFPKKDKIKLLDDNISFLDDQTLKLTNQSELLNKKIDEISSKYDISYTFGSSGSTGSQGSLGSMGSKNSQSISVNNASSGFIKVNTDLNILAASQKIREIDEKIKLFKEVETDESKFMTLANNVLPKNQISNLLQKNDLDMLYASSIFVEDEQIIKDILLERDYLFKKNLTYVFDYLNSEKSIANALIESNKRPRKIINEYKRLIRKYQRQIMRIYNFESQKENLILEKANAKSTWDVITEPTTSPGAIYPNRRVILSFFTFMGFFGSVAISYLFLLKKDFIYFSEDVNQIINLPELFKLNASDPESWKEKLSLFFTCNKEILKYNKVNFIIIGKNTEKFLDIFDDKIEDILNNKIFQKTNKFSYLESDVLQIPIILTSDFTKKDLIYNNKNLLIQDANNLGYILIYPSKLNFYDC